MLSERFNAKSTIMNPKQKTVSCPQCGSTFMKRRKDQTYCKDTCRKLTYQKKDRAANPMNSQSSQAKRRTNLEFFDTALRLAERLYTTPPHQRLGFMKHLIDTARSGDKKLQDILTNQYLLRDPNKEKSLYYLRRPTCYKTIAQAADAYCRKFWGASVANVVKGIADEPEAGEVVTDESSSPSYKSIPRDPNVTLKASSPSIKSTQSDQTQAQMVATKYTKKAMSSSGIMRTMCLQMADRAKAKGGDITWSDHLIINDAASMAPRDLGFGMELHTPPKLQRPQGLASRIT
jgi:ribosomal protein S27AE